MTRTGINCYDCQYGFISKKALEKFIKSIKEKSWTWGDNPDPIKKTGEDQYVITKKTELTYCKDCFGFVNPPGWMHLKECKCKCKGRITLDAKQDTDTTKVSE